MILEASFTLIYVVYSTGVTFDDHQLTSVIFLQWRDMVSLPLLHQTQELELTQAYTINII